ncbi:MAG: class I SAM-dependent methyltransferase family protein [Candidatus Bathyarchaeota archaeon]|nr:MAG: class I SAM-dependent methyltransferase family protein [Candidatus Bathyarchaeota archaeon]
MRKRLRKNPFTVPSSGDSREAYVSYDIIGNIAVIRVSSVSPENTQNVAKTIMNIHKNVKTVLVQVGPVVGDFRLRRLTHVAGENKTSTIHKEYGCLFSVDVEKCYFSPRLSHERMRIAGIVKPNETVVNMFAGVGCFSIIIAKHANVAKVLSIDVNPMAIQFMHENIRLNRVYNKVIPILGDSKEIVNSQLHGLSDRVLMPLPEKAFEYLHFAVSALKASGGWVHYYDFEHAEKTEKPFEKTKLKVAEKLASLDLAFKLPFSRVVRSIGPNWYQVALDIHITHFPDKS